MHIGVFDSGIGGLTVLRALRRRWPGHSTTYLGDTARVPYGTKSPETVARYARQNAKFLIAQGIDLLVLACNTASAHAGGALADLGIPYIGMIEPGARAAVAQAGDGVIGVIATSGTVASGAYARAIQALRPGARVESIACPMFVPLVEEGWLDDAVTEAVARRYLAPWLADGAAPQAVVLGCTHYPMLKNLLSGVLGTDVALIDSAESAAKSLAPFMEGAAPEAAPRHRLCVTDDAPGFAAIAARILEEAPGPLERVDVNFDADIPADAKA